MKRIFGYIREWWHLHNAHFYIVRFKIIPLDSPGPGNVTGRIYKQMFVGIIDKKIHFFDQSRHGIIVGFWTGILLRRRLKKTYPEYEFSLELYGDVQMMNEIYDRQ